MSSSAFARSLARRGSRSVAWEDGARLASHSDFVLDSAPSSSVELRIVRRGNQFDLLARAIGAPSWTLLRSHAHPEFQSSMQLGSMIHGHSAPVDIRVHVDRLAIRS